MKEGDEEMNRLVDTSNEYPTDSYPSAPRSWETSAACRLIPNAPEVFFSEDLGEIATAKRICSGCTVLPECLEQALERREPWGVWGGQLFMNGRMLTVKRRRGRPPKTPRPDDLMPIVAVPAHLADQVRRRTA